MRKNVNGDFTWWVSHYYDDFTAARCVSDDLDDVMSTTITHANSHFGNPMNGEATMNHRYRYSIVERKKGDGSSVSVHATSTAAGYYLHNNGVHEWLTHDPIRLHPNDYPGRVRLTYPDSNAHSNRYRYRESTSGSSLSGDLGYMWFANGLDSMQSSRTFNAPGEPANTIGRYWVPTGIREASYGRSNVQRMDEGNSNWLHEDRGKSQHAVSSEWIQSTNLAGVYSGELVPTDASPDSVGGASGGQAGGWGPIALMRPIYSSAGKPFLVCQSYIPQTDFNVGAGYGTRTHSDDDYWPIIAYEGPMKLRTNDVFSIRLSWAHGKVAITGTDARRHNLATIDEADGTYRLRIGFDGNHDDVTLSSIGYDANGMYGATHATNATFAGYVAEWQFNPSDGTGMDGTYASASAMIGATGLKSLYVQSTKTVDDWANQSLDHLWWDIDFVFNFTTQKYEVYIDGDKQGTTWDMGTTLDGEAWDPDMHNIYGWDLGIKANDDQEDCLYTTLIDRVSHYTPLTDPPSGDEKPFILGMQYQAGVNTASSVTIDIEDDNNEHATGIQTRFLQTLSYDDSELMLFRNNADQHNYFGRPLWRGKINKLEIKQGNKEQSKILKITSNDVSADLDKELLNAVNTQALTSGNNNTNIWNQRASELQLLRNSMLLGGRVLVAKNSGLGFDRTSGYKETTDQRMALHSAHPIQMYNDEDEDGPNSVDDAWQTGTLPTGVARETIENRSIHAERIRDICASNWFKQKFARILNGHPDHLPNIFKGYNSWTMNNLSSGQTIGSGTTSMTIRPMSNNPNYSHNGAKDYIQLQKINDKKECVWDIQQYKGNYQSMIQSATHITDLFKHTESFRITSATHANDKDVTNVAASGAVANFTCASHGYSVGDYVMLHSFTESGYARNCKVGVSTDYSSGSSLPSGGGTTWGYGLMSHGTVHHNMSDGSGPRVDSRQVYRVSSTPTTNTFTLQTVSLKSSGIQNDPEYVSEEVLFAGAPATVSGRKMKVVKIPVSGTCSTFEITINFPSGQLINEYTTTGNLTVGLQPRMMSNDFKHIWVMFSDMRNNGKDDADGLTKESDFGIVYPLSDNYSFNLVSSNDLLDEESNTRENWLELKVGEDIDIWEIDASHDPSTAAHWGTTGGNSRARSGVDWAKKSGSFLIIDTSPFFNLNTENNGGNSWMRSGGRKDLADYFVETEGYPILLDNYWDKAMAQHDTHEVESVQHANEHRILNRATIMDAENQSAPHSNNAEHYIDSGDLSVKLENCFSWPKTCFDTDGTVNHVGMVRARTNSGDNAGFTDYYYVYDFKIETTLNGAVSKGANTITLTSTSGLQSSGSVSINGIRIEYTGISSNNLTGVTGVSQDFNDDALVSDNILHGFYLTWIDPLDTVDREYDEILTLMNTRYQNSTGYSKAKIKDGVFNSSSSTISHLRDPSYNTGTNDSRYSKASARAGNEGFWHTGGGVGGSFSGLITGVTHYSTGVTSTHAIDDYIFRNATGSEFSLFLKGEGIANNTPQVYDEITFYSSCSNIYPLKLMMQVDGYVEAPNVGTYYHSDKVRYLNNIPFVCSWLLQNGSHVISDLNNVPVTINMDTLQTGSTTKDSYGTVLDYRTGGTSLLQIYGDIQKSSSVGSGGLNTSFSWLIGRDGKFDLRPKYNSGWVFNRDNLTVSNMTIQNDRINNVRVYYNNGLSFADYPGEQLMTDTDRRRWEVIHSDSIRNKEEALAVAKTEFQKHASTKYQIDAQVIRHSDGHTLNPLSNDTMLKDARFGYVADQCIRAWGLHMHDLNAGLGGCHFPGMVNAFDGNLDNADTSSSTYGYGANNLTTLADNAANTGVYSWNEWYGHYGSKSVSYAMQIVHIPHGMPYVSETSGNHLRIGITPTNTGTDTAPKFRVEFIDPVFNTTKSAGYGATASADTYRLGDNVATPMLFSSYAGGSTGTGVSTVDVTGNGFIEIGIPSAYWSAAGSKKIVISVNYDYLHSLLKYRCGSTDGTLSSAIRKPKHASATLSYSASFNAHSIFPLGIYADETWGGIYGGGAHGRAMWYAPRLHITDDLNFIPATYVTYTDSHLGLTNTPLTISSVNWSISRHKEKVDLKLTSDESAATNSVVGTIFPNINPGRKGGGRTDPPLLPPTLPPPNRPPPMPPYGDPNPPLLPPTHDLPGTPLGSERSGSNRTGHATGSHASGSASTRHESNQPYESTTTDKVGVNRLSEGVLKRMKGKMDLPYDGVQKVLGSSKPKNTPSETHSMGVVDSVTTSSGDALATEEGIILPGSTAAGEKSESSHVMIIRMPRDAVKNNSISIVAKASLGNTTGSAVIYTKLENIDTGLSMEHTTTISAGTDASSITLLPKTTVPHIAGTRFKVTITRKVGTGDDDLYFSSIRLHTLQVTYERDSIPSKPLVSTYGRNSDGKRTVMDRGLD
tara:strand:+ start:6600 stop:13841 length:7242 start_codon:yes stop_codon:yes gene_type:complete